MWRQGLHPLEKAHIVALLFAPLTNNIQDRGTYKHENSQIVSWQKKCASSGVVFYKERWWHWHKLSDCWFILRFCEHFTCLKVKCKGFESLILLPYSIKIYKKSLKIPKGGNQNLYIEEEQTTQWPKEKVQKDKQRSTKHTYKTKDRVTRTPLKTGGQLRWSGRVCSSCSTSDTRRVNLVTNPVISHERWQDREAFTTSRTYPWSIVTQVFHNGQPSRGGDRKTFDVMTST